MNNGDLKHQVLEQLRAGRHHALPGKLLAQRLGFRNDRAIRAAIRELVADGFPIVGSVTPPLGFFIAETKEEVKLYAANMRSRLIEDAYRRRDFLRAARRIVNPEQMRLKI